MQMLAGTSGYSYKEWLGRFYPERLPANAMLRYYAERFATVEINNTFGAVVLSLQVTPTRHKPAFLVSG